MIPVKTFVTLYPRCENSYLIKDTGQIPYFMNKIHGYDASIVTYKIGDEYTHLEGEVKGLNIAFISNFGAFLFIELAVIKYIFQNAKKVDVLNFFHLSKQTFIYGILYKIRNPLGFLYVKLDAYNEALKNDVVYSKSTIKNSILKWFEKILLRKADLFSIENREGEILFKKKYPSVSNKTIYLPNGVNDLFLKEHFKNRKKHSEKENIIITTGRIGMKVKNHEMILKAVARINMKDWKLYFVGPVHLPFMDFFEELCKVHPHLKNKVYFTGEVLDRKVLYEWYNRSKIFCMTSPYESFGISIIEAMYFGNYLVGTEGISTIKDFTNNGQYGEIVKLNDYDRLGKILENLINNEDLISTKQKDISQYIEENFLWSKITTQLKNRIAKSD